MAEETEPCEAESSEVLIKVDDEKPEGYDGTCLRPLGLCELGMCCDVCWYRPDHPRFQKP
jgi:hypothetical protein